MRVLVTGSRDWPDDGSMMEEFAALHASFPYHATTIIHGACPTGADAIADRLARYFGFKVETYPAAWETQGTRAGYLRNKAMVESNPDLCLAYIKDDSKGATMTLKMAQDAGILTRVRRLNSDAAKANG